MPMLLGLLDMMARLIFLYLESGAQNSLSLAKGSETLRHCCEKCLIA